jgi:hypothetical protein
MYQRTNAKQRLQSFTRINDAKNSECQVCSDDTQTIYILQVKDLSGITLETLKKEILSSLAELSDKTFMI